MKKILILLFFIPVISLAQSKKDTLKWLKDTIALAPLQLDSTKTISYKLISTTPGISKNELYNRAKEWAALAFNSSKNVIQLDDKEGGSIIIKALSKQSVTYKLWFTTIVMEYYLHYSLQFKFKEDKYRLILSGFSVETMGDLQIPAVTYTLEQRYKELKEWNINAKTGNMQFNKANNGSPDYIRPQFETINNLNDFAIATLAEAKNALSKPAKADDF